MQGAEQCKPLSAGSLQPGGAQLAVDAVEDHRVRVDVAVKGVRRLSLLVHPRHRKNEPYQDRNSWSLLIDYSIYDNRL